MREKVINLSRFGLRKHAEIAKYAEISFKLFKRPRITRMYTDYFFLKQKPQKHSRCMYRAFQPFAMQGIYFSFKTSFKIKITPFHLCLLQSQHILREQKLQFVSNLKNHFVQR